MASEPHLLTFEEPRSRIAKPQMVFMVTKSGRLLVWLQLICGSRTMDLWLLVAVPVVNLFCLARTICMLKHA
jgi:hypothetical protein